VEVKVKLFTLPFATPGTTTCVIRVLIEAKFVAMSATAAESPETVVVNVA